MENMLKSAFDAVQMSDDCTQKIENAMKEAAGRSPARRIRRAAAVAACLMVILLVGTHPTVVQALEEILKPFTMGTIYIDEHRYFYNDGNRMISGTHNWNIDAEEIIAETPEGPWLTPDIEEGKLYFITKDEKIDITELISYDTPFTYSFTDDAGILHYIAVGGEFTVESGLNNVGRVEFLRYEPAASEDSEAIHAGWMGGHVVNYCDKDGNTYGWVIRAYEELGLPWSPPGD